MMSMTTITIKKKMKRPPPGARTLRCSTMVTSFDAAAVATVAAEEEEQEIDRHPEDDETREQPAEPGGHKTHPLSYELCECYKKLTADLSQLSDGRDDEALRRSTEEALATAEQKSGGHLFADVLLHFRLFGHPHPHPVGGGMHRSASDESLDRRLHQRSFDGVDRSASPTKSRRRPSLAAVFPFKILSHHSPSKTDRESSLPATFTMKDPTNECYADRVPVQDRDRSNGGLLPFQLKRGSLHCQPPTLRKKTPHCSPLDISSHVMPRSYDELDDKDSQEGPQEHHHQQPQPQQHQDSESSEDEGKPHFPHLEISNHVIPRSYNKVDNEDAEVPQEQQKQPPRQHGSESSEEGSGDINDNVMAVAAIVSELMGLDISIHDMSTSSDESDEGEAPQDQPQPSVASEPASPTAISPGAKNNNGIDAGLTTEKDRCRSLESVASPPMKRQPTGLVFSKPDVPSPPTMEDSNHTISEGCEPRCNRSRSEHRQQHPSETALTNPDKGYCSADENGDDKKRDDRRRKSKPAPRQDHEADMIMRKKYKPLHRSFAHGSIGGVLSTAPRYHRQEPTLTTSSPSGSGEAKEGTPSSPNNGGSGGRRKASKSSAKKRLPPRSKRRNVKTVNEEWKAIYNNGTLSTTAEGLKGGECKPGSSHQQHERRWSDVSNSWIANGVQFCKTMDVFVFQK